MEVSASIPHWISQGSSRCWLWFWGRQQLPDANFSAHWPYTKATFRTVSTPKQSMTLLVAGQFVGNSIPPRVVPCPTANSPMFAALASSPIVTTPINPNVQCPMPPLLQKTATKHNFARPVTPITKTSACMGAFVGWWLRPWFYPTLREVWCFPHWSWQMPGAYPPCISAQWPLSYHRSSVPTCHSADTRWTGKR